MKRKLILALALGITVTAFAGAGGVKLKPPTPPAWCPRGAMCAAP
jgi:hypothetical protein